MRCCVGVPPIWLGYQLKRKLADSYVGAVLQKGEVEPFVCELLTSLTGIIQDLETHQIHMFFEAVGLMISADTDAKKREMYLVRTLCVLSPGLDLCMGELFLFFLHRSIKIISCFSFIVPV